MIPLESISLIVLPRSTNRGHAHECRDPLQSRCGSQGRRSGSLSVWGKPTSVPTPLIPGWHREYASCALVMVYSAEFVLYKITQLSASFNLSVRLRLQLQDNDFRLGFAGTSFCNSLQTGLVLGNRQSCWLPKVVACQGQPAAPCPC